MDCVLYVRVSTDHQKGGLDSQIADIKKYAKGKHKIIKEFKEDPKSGFKDVVREKFEDMYEYVLENDIKLILCWEISRFGRSSIRSMKRIKEYQKAGVEVYFLHGGISTKEDNAHSKFQLQMLFGLAELERDSIIERSRRGRDASAMEGKRVGMPNLAYGITVDEDNKYIENKEESKYVKKMYDWFLQGKTYRWIAGELTELGIATRKKQGGWQASTVRNILKNPIYSGLHKYRGEPVELGFAIIRKDKWDKTQTIVKEKISYYHRERTPSRTNKYTHKFKGKIVCGHCGRRYGTMSEVTNQEEYTAAEKEFMSKHTSEEIEKMSLDEFFSKVPAKNISYAYRCAGVSKIIAWTDDNKPIRCDAGQIKQSVIDDAITIMVTGNKSFFTEKFRKKREDYNVDEESARLTHVKNELKKIDRRREIAKDFFSKDANEVSYSRRMAEITRDERELKQKKSKIEQDRNEFYDRSEDSPISLFLNGDLESEDIEKLVEKVILYKVKKWKINWTRLPKKTNVLTFDKEDERIKIVEKSNGMNKVPKGAPDKVVYIELYVFNISEPVKAVVTSVTKNFYVDEDLDYIPKSRTLRLAE